MKKRVSIRFKWFENRPHTQILLDYSFLVCKICYNVCCVQWYTRQAHKGAHSPHIERVVLLFWRQPNKLNMQFILFSSQQFSSHWIFFLFEREWIFFDFCWCGCRHHRHCTHQSIDFQFNPIVNNNKNYFWTEQFKD